MISFYSSGSFTLYGMQLLCQTRPGVRLIWHETREAQGEWVKIIIRETVLRSPFLI
jgi:hypothetical protein